MVVAERLSRLCDELHHYRTRLSEYDQATAAFQAKRARMLEELQERDRLSETPVAGKEPTQDAAGGAPWFGPLTINLWRTDASAPPQTAQQRAAEAAERRRREVDEKLGQLPPAPQPPKGVYIYGSVGSGKSMLMDMLYGIVSKHSLVPFHRRVHFNALMLEMNQRLHRLEQQAKQRHDSDAAARPAPAKPALTRVAQPSVAASHASALATFRQHASAAWGLASGDGGPSRGSRPMFRPGAPDEAVPGEDDASDAPWTGGMPHDGEVRRQKEAKLAVIAARRRARQLRSVGENTEALARSNSPFVLAAARSLIRAEASPAADTADPAAGWDAHGRIAAVLCFDEMQVTSVFEAVALKGMMEALIMDDGCVVVATSNRPPWELNKHGLHEDIFLHFVNRLTDVCDVISLGGGVDYRRMMTNESRAALGARSSSDADSTYIYPDTAENRRRVDTIWREALVRGQPVTAATLPVMFGRQLHVPQTAGGAARLHFDDLCAKNLGSADYIALAGRFHTVLLDGVPAMSMQVRDRARRFITLVDELYNHRVRLICCAEVPPDELFVGADNEQPLIDLESLQFESAVPDSRLRTNINAPGGVAPVLHTAGSIPAVTAKLGGAEERFAFKRAVSRLLEMQSEPYILSRDRSA